MKTIANEPATPCTGYNKEHLNVNFKGLTKREHFAAMALSGNQGYEFKGYENPADVASRAVEIADALIEALNKDAK